ncbi:MAG: YbhB/YbcL family Raf kinase inhibitor-like protein [Acidobacteriota bacterium]|nr:YbhB/YbcL family Raf kinase inhibitor-like protein [Acidobacteriota bacterium]
MFRVFSSAFAEGGWIPRLHTCDGADVSPSVEWSEEPRDTRSFALLVEDPDAPRGVWTHWMLYDIPRAVRTLAQGVARVGLAGRNDFGRAGYGGPCPPPGDPHRYYFRLMAMRVEKLGIAEGATRAEFDRAISGKVVGEAVYMGRYRR